MKLLAPNALTLMALTSLVLATAAPLTAQEAIPAAGQAAGSDTDAELGRELKRILHLADGGTLRVKARSVGGTWEFRSDRDWRALPAGAVVRAELERDVVRAAEVRARELSENDLDGHVALADWMRAEGLVAESLAELDRVLGESAHHPRALALLRSHRFLPVPSLDVEPAALQEASIALFDWAIRRPRAAQELALIEFERMRDTEGFAQNVARALNSHSLERRAFAARLLGRLFPRQDVQRLLVHAVLDGSAEVRQGAAEALAAAAEPGLTLPILRALTTSPSSRVRTQAAEALGVMAYAAAVPALVSHLAAPAQAGSSNRLPHSNIFIGKQMAYIQDFDVEVAQFQSIADPQINVLLEGSVLDAAVVSSREEITSVERSAVRRSLRKLTGADPGNTVRAWLEWWDENGPAWSRDEQSAAD